jgi:acyl-coenzyme A synthetase/AMP-(fatty) acid ligase
LPTGGPQWRLDVVAYSHEQVISGRVEKELLVLPEVVHATLVWICNPGMGPMPRLYIQEKAREHRRKIANKSRKIMRKYFGDEAVRSRDWLAFGEVPRTRSGQVDRDYYRRYKFQSRDS